LKLLYAESSAVLAWLLGEAQQDAVLDALGSADGVLTSVLTLIECARGLGRARDTERITETQRLAALHLLDQAATGWNVLDISDIVAQRARESFPVEPVRTLDALHLATMLAFIGAVGPIEVLCLDERVRRNAQALGLTVLPIEPAGDADVRVVP
jgi:predicted nucleic acid-binding protein